VTITKALSILCDAGEAGVLVSGTKGIVIAAGAADVVYLKGLDIDGIGAGLNGVQFNSGAVLRITDSTIHQFNAGAGAGVSFAPSTAGTGKRVIENTVISDNGGATFGNGVFVAPTNGAVADVSLKNVQVTNNGAGLRFDTTGTGGGRINAVVRDSTIAQNALSGVVAVGPVSVQVLLDGASIAHNGGFGVNSVGVGALVTITRSSITQNVTGLSVTGGVIASYGDNEIDHNTNAGVAPTTIAHQ
jgi:polygalacturonase